MQTFLCLRRAMVCRRTGPPNLLLCCPVDRMTPAASSVVPDHLAILFNQIKNKSNKDKTKLNFSSANELFLSLLLLLLLLVQFGTMNVNLTSVLINNARRFVELLQTMFASSVLVDRRVRRFQLVQFDVQFLVLYAAERTFDLLRSLTVGIGSKSSQKNLSDRGQ